MASMLDRCGGSAGLSQIIMAFYDRALDSPVLYRYFGQVDLSTLLDHQTKFIASLMGGSESYSDDHLRRLHAHLKIDKAAFDEMLSLFEQTLRGFEMDPPDLKAIMNELRRREPLIVTQGS